MRRRTGQSWDDLTHGKMPGPAHRNGLPGTGPEFRPYVYGTSEARRRAEVDRILAGVRARLDAEGGTDAGAQR